MDQFRRPFTPETLAERWECSAETIRLMCRNGQLASFKVGKMYRIPAASVDAHESTKVEPAPRPPIDWKAEPIVIRHTCRCRASRT